jgi:hypothetical protein
MGNPPGYSINRAGQVLGPYTLIEIQQYLAEGRLGRNEAACLNGDQNWVPLYQLLEPRPSNPPSGPLPAARQPTGPVPPSLHWALVWLLSTVSSGIFLYIWLFVQASFVHKLNRNSKATLLFGLAAGCIGGCLFAFVGLGVASAAASQQDSGDINAGQAFILGLALMFFAGAIALTIAGIFSIRAILQTYYRDVEPIGFSHSGQPMGLRLSGVMTFFFGVYYIQYHLSRLARWKETGVLM